MGIFAGIVISAIVALLVDAYKEEIKVFFKGIFKKKDK